MLKDLQLSQVYKLIEPGPVVLLATVQKGRPNVMAMSWHMMMEFNPPLIACIVSGANHTFKALSRTGECVIAIPTVELASLVVKIGNVSGRDVNKFEALGISTSPAAEVAAPLLTDCYVNLECRVSDTTLVRKYNLFVLEVVKAWIDRAKRTPRTLHHKGFGSFTVDGETLRLKSQKP
jgi:flavin reductase (DIM6/NTAB) family NADH-FMN oxidoreductase RutF